MTINLNGVAWVIHTDTSTGGINRVSSSPSNLADLLTDGTIVGSETLYHLTIGEEETYNISSPAGFMIRYHRSGDSWVDRGERPTDYYNWNFYTSKWEVDSIRLLRDVRIRRNMRLGESDWTQGADSPLTDEKKAEWVIYRQALRDLMHDLLDDFGTLSLDDPEETPWPTPPS